MRRAAERLEILTAASTAALIAATWPLWLPAGDFPQAPLFAFAIDASRAGDIVGLAGMLAGAAVAGGCRLALSSRRSRGGSERFLDAVRIGGWSVFLASAALMSILNQHRCQAWVWQFLILGTVFATAPKDRVVPLVRVLTVSLYAHSALGKLDRSFVEGNGAQILDVLLGFVRESPPGATAAVGAWPLIFPIGELCIAVGLCFRRTRRLAVALAVAMHATLLFVLGPLGLNHSAGVLLWNLFFIAQVILLFSSRNPDRAVSARSDPGADDDSRLSAASRRERGITRNTLASVLVWGVALLPLLAPFGWLDPWLAWDLYSSRPARIRLSVDAAVIDRLPLALRPHIEPAEPLGDWRRVRIDRWSLDATRAPISPQVRFQFAVALAVIRDAGLTGREARIDWESAADRWSGRRRVRTLLGVEEIERRAREFRLNAQPRGITRRRATAAPAFATSAGACRPAFAASTRAWASWDGAFSGDSRRPGSSRQAAPRRRRHSSAGRDTAGR